MILVNLFNPEMIVIGGGLAQEWQAYIEPAIQVMRVTSCCTRSAQEVPVVPTQLGGTTEVMGAVALVRQAHGSGKPTIR